MDDSRTTGGGAVYHDLGNLNYSFITDAGDKENLTMEKFTEPVIEALQKLGIDAMASGRNDILANGKKISGTAQRLHKDRILHHGTLLFDSDSSAIADALSADKAKFASKSAKSVKSRVGNIREMLPPSLQAMSMEQFWTHLEKCLAGVGVIAGELNDKDLAAIMK